MTECFYDNHHIQTFGYKRNKRGVYYLGRFDLKETKDKFEIWALGVPAKYRRKGYATRMLREFIAQFKFEKPLVLYVLKGNKIAIHLYEKVGFAIVGECNFNKGAYEMQYQQ